MDDVKITGSCLCGGIKFELTKPPLLSCHCHCSMCRKFTGAGVTTLVTIHDPEGIRYLSDTSNIKKYRSSDKLTRMFCGICGSSFADKFDPKPSVLSLYAGIFDRDHIGVNITGHMFYGSKAPWVQVNDGLPVSEEFEVAWDEYMAL